MPDSLDELIERLNRFDQTLSGENSKAENNGINYVKNIPNGAGIKESNGNHRNAYSEGKDVKLENKKGGGGAPWKEKDEKKHEHIEINAIVQEN